MFHTQWESSETQSLLNWVYTILHSYNPWLALLYQSGMCMDDKIMENVRKTSIYRIMTSEIGITNMKCILFSDRSDAWHGLIMEGGRGHSSFS